MSGREIFRLHTFIPIPTHPGFGVYFFLSYLPSKTLYIWAHGFLLYIKSKASLAICQGFLEKRGVIRFDLGDNTGALEDLNMAISLQSHYAEAYYNRGLVKEKMGEKKEAIADDQLAISYQPNYGEAYYNLALATYDDKNPSSRVASLNYLQKAANALIKTGNLELYERTVEWMLKMQ